MTISKNKMIELEKRTIEEFKIDSLILMENAGMGIFREINQYDSFTIICGKGNNGGDGLVIARHLILNGKIVEVFVVGDKETKEFFKNLEIIKKLTDVKYIEDDNFDELIESIEVNEITVDAIFGTGLNRNLNKFYRRLIDTINVHGNYIIGVDIPSGMDADTGEEYGNCVACNVTYAISDIKNGELLNSNVGELKKIYIGIVRYKDE
ncbi:MAG: NAD(P)H-hydrate epimerase [Peptoniphilus sp.]|uniref:NAD(P)H-hydrate epimerase n=1 Tax=Peptoniphilus sp. TaxID=1971214 RepID=UPI0025D17663|nr:NAD(P)H-hydrate epimerase [Peptoniphilus sp.]MCI5643320.1 NAD(P)H-hydrate epimerase [Peptoniphilus sp.]MDY3903211.1 NAD(P)H-hydrate epimerase [Peptoniphilus sp.]